MSMTSSYSAAARTARPKLARLDTSERKSLVRNDAASGSRPGTPPSQDGSKRMSPRGSFSSASPRLAHWSGADSKWQMRNRRSPSASPTLTPSRRSPASADVQGDVAGTSGNRLSPERRLLAASNHDDNSEGTQVRRRRLAPSLRVSSSTSTATPPVTRMATQHDHSAPMAPRIPTIPAFEVSEITPNFLYLGPEITTAREAAYLRDQLGIRRILNSAWEIEDGGGQGLRLNDESISGFERYLKLPLKDTVEAKGVQKSIEEACAFLDDARLHSAPTYVHCKAGKSRSVMLVMAFLIHSNKWTLSRAYEFVAERRRDVSPNIGFVAELMAFAERQTAATHRQMRGENADGDGGRSDRSCRSTSAVHEQNGSQLGNDTTHFSPRAVVSAPANMISGDNLLSPETMLEQSAPIDEPRRAPNRRSMLAAIETDNLILRSNAIRLLDSASCERSSYPTHEVTSSNSNSTGTFSTGSAMSS